ncbi:MAG: hypothetical protein QOF16_819 [Actinomycetota bacterium]|nr:hypothetical protein [Actinomycetota bacterium]
MSRLESARLLEAEESRSFGRRRYRLDDETLVVSPIDPIDDATREPVSETVDDDPSRVVARPLAACELIDLVSRLLAEKASKILSVFGNDMNRE